ncbi:MAG: hypothetical protein CSA50_04100 [Gammaproteobacteria bacterium]|nr:MAG: hypothetical protein CSA50_04100 [Gammaproteobacteria bacterium]
MPGDNNIVDLQKIKAEAERATANELAIPLPVLKITSLFKSTALTCFKQMFEDADDVLFARADKAETNSEQIVYFDAMRDLRLYQKNIEVAFLQSVGSAIRGIRQTKSSAKAGFPVLADDLSLVGLDDMESRVAIEAMITKINDRAASSIEHLQIRIQTLFPNIEITRRMLPFGPFSLCYAFSDALSELDMDIRARLIIFKLFDRFFTEQLVVFYQKANQLLTKLGILPEMVSGKPVTRRTQADYSEAPGERQSDNILSSSGKEVESGFGSAWDAKAVGQNPHAYGSAGSGINFSLLQQALRRRSASSQDDAKALAGDYPVSAGQASLSVDELVRAVSAIQGEFYQDADEGVPAIKGNGSVIADVLKLVRQRIAEAGRDRPINQRDADVASLVGLLFNFVLEDDHLPTQMKQVISTWQIPFLKLALQDASFFDRESHPARHLLNQVSKAVIGWQPKEKGRDFLLEKIEKFTRQMVLDKNLNPQLFADLNQEMSAFLDAERRRSSLIAQRLKDAEEGRVKSDLAKKKVERTIQRSLAGKRLPEELVEAIEKGWSKKMVVAWLQGGEQSAEWQSLSRFIEELVWSVDPDETGVEARGKLLQMMPRLLRDWREGLTDISYDMTEIDKSLAMMETCHKQSLRRIEKTQWERLDSEKPGLPGLGFESQEKRHSTDKAAIAALPVSGLDDKVAEKGSPKESENQSVPAAQAKAVIVKSDLETIWEQRVDQLRIGSWFEFLPKGGEKQRFKLAAAIKLNGRHVFVNRNGVKLAEFEKDELIAELASGRLMPLDDGQIFDRALESIISGLRH